MLNQVFKLSTLPALPEDWLSMLAEDVLPAFSIAFFVLLLILEIIPVHRKQSKNLMLRSYRTNISTFVFNDLMLSLLSVSSLLLLAERYQDSGILSSCNQPIKLVLAFILFDLTLYIWHWANHHYDFLWMFHKAHHSDRSMNVSTAFRVHFIEVLLTTLVKALFIMLAGVEASIVAVCEAVSMLFAMYHHLNFSFRHEKWLKWLFIVPAMHRVHHSSLRKEHDSNYGAIFSIWDRLFRTVSESQTGAIGLVNIKALDFYELLRFGMMPAASKQTQPEPQAINKDEMIADAAYFIAEKRGFVPGNEIHDWIEAELQIQRTLFSPGAS